MKKYLILLMSIALLCGCSPQRTAINNITEVCYAYWNGGNEQVDISLSTGKREDPYIQDGHVGNLVDFTLLCFTLLDEVELDPNCTIIIDQKEYNIELQKSPFNNSYACDLQVVTDKNAIVGVKFDLDGNSHSIALENLSQNFSVSYLDAIDIFFAQFDTKCSQDGWELCCKVIASPIHSNMHFWYVRVLFESGKDCVCVIDTETGDILASK